MQYDTAWHGFCFRTLWHASLFNWTRFIVYLEQIEILIMCASWHAAAMFWPIFLMIKAKQVFCFQFNLLCDWFYDRFHEKHPSRSEWSQWKPQIYRTEVRWLAMVGRLVNGNFYASGIKLQLRIACNSWLRETEVIGQIRWEWKLHFRCPLGLLEQKFSRLHS